MTDPFLLACLALTAVVNGITLAIQIKQLRRERDSA